MASERVPTIPEIRRREKCQTCAFRVGTEANKSKLTLIKASLCADTGTPFLCHEDTPLEVMCSGFTDMFANRVNSIRDQPQWKNELAGHLLEVIDEAETGKLKHEEYGARIKSILDKMNEEQKGGRHGD